MKQIDAKAAGYGHLLAIACAGLFACIALAFSGESEGACEESWKAVEGSWFVRLEDNESFVKHCETCVRCRKFLLNNQGSEK